MMRFIFLLLIYVLGFMSSSHATELRIGAASNLRFVLAELTQSFEQQTGHQCHISFAASGTLASQILHGAPFDIFMSANPDYVHRLKSRGYTQGEASNYAHAQLALYATNSSKLGLDLELNSIRQALADGSLKKVVIANSHHAPYGQLAKKLLEQHGLWSLVQPHLLIAENAAQSLQFSMSPQVSLGFVPYTYVIQPNISETGRSLKFNEQLVQQAVIIKGADGAAQQWLDYLSSESAQKLLVKHGFLVNEQVKP